MPTSYRYLLALLMPLALVAMDAGSGDAIHVHIFSGSKEYQSKPSLEAWQQRLEADYGFTTSLFHANDKSKVGTEAFKPLAEADLMVVFCRRWKLDEDAQAALQAYLDSGKPIIGIRTGSHAWNVDGFDHQIMGGSYSGHGGGEEVAVTRNEAQQDHPILDGVGDWTRQGKLYHNKENAEDTVLLLTGTGKDGSDPLAWCRIKDGRRTFYTGMGYPHDFANENFQQLLHNALEWCLERELTAGQEH